VVLFLWGGRSLMDEERGRGRGCRLVAGREESTRLAMGNQFQGGDMEGRFLWEQRGPLRLLGTALRRLEL
jgi:hypothetical protein